MSNKHEEALNLAISLKRLLEKHGDVEWTGFMRSIIFELQDANNAESFENAKALYSQMLEGGRRFAEYYFPVGKACNREANIRLENLKDKLWRAFYD